MISIPVAVSNDFFRWQLDLFWYSHKLTYGDDAKNKAFAIVIDRNDIFETAHKEIYWDINLPCQLCRSFYDILNIDYNHEYLKPMNIQIGLQQIIDRFDDNEILELLDCDLLHFNKAPEFFIQDNEIIVSNIYEDWHLKSLSDNKNVIEPYFLNNGNYYNGGFVPIIGKAKTFKKILSDWILIHRDIVEKHPNDQPIKWWAGMYSLSAACERNKIQMIGRDICYIPNINQLSDHHYICHYSVDPIFNKKVFPTIDLTTFKSNRFYDIVKEWFQLYK